MEFDIREFDEVTSTNDVVKELALAGEPEGVVVSARSQTAGYGRRGHKWESQPGSLYMSLLLRPQGDSAQIETLPLAVAIAVQRALASFLTSPIADTVQVKWPNDVVVSAPGDAFNKICGISSELKHGAICVGIGVNVHSPERMPVVESESPERNRPTYLDELLPDGSCPSTESVRDAVLARLAGIYERWQDFGFAPLRDEYMRHFALRGLTARIDDALAFVGDGTMPTREVPCCAIQGVDDEGRLVGKACDSGDVVKVIAGRIEVIHGE